MLDVRARVIAVDVHPLPYFTVRLELPGDYPAAAPGQFVMVQIGDGLEPYLRRAFSIYDLVDGERRVDDPPRDGRGDASGASTPAPNAARAPREMRLLGKVVGRGTAALGASRAGDQVSVLGPLGRGFRVAGGSDSGAKPPGAGIAAATERAPRSAASANASGRGQRVALVAGGVGSAALLLLARQLASVAVFDVFYGGRRREDLPDADRFARLAEGSGGELLITTEDGSAGRRGLVTEPLAERLAAGAYGYLYACGPMGLLARLAVLAAEHGVAGEAALETPMGCGYGACLGCAVPHRAGHFALCCKDGPVFRFDEVAW